MICRSVRTVRAQPRRYGGHRDHPPPPQFLRTHFEGRHGCRYPPFYSQFKIGTVLDILGIRRSKPTAHEGYNESSIFRPGSSFLLCTITRVKVSPRCGGVPPRCWAQGTISLLAWTANPLGRLGTSHPTSFAIAGSNYRSSCESTTSDANSFHRFSICRSS